MPNNTTPIPTPSTIPVNKAFKLSLSANLIGFCRLLREQDVSIGFQEEIDALKALEFVPLEDVDSFYLVLRSTLAKSYKAQLIFDELFDGYWKIWDISSLDRYKQRLEESKKKSKPSPAAQNPNSGFTTISDWLKKEDDIEEEKEAAGYSSIDVVTQKDFSLFYEMEVDKLKTLIQLLGKNLANRISRRHKLAASRGPLDLRNSIRKNLRNSSEIIKLYRKKKRPKKLKLVLLCDVSKSMDLYSRFILQFLYVFQQTFRQIDTFIFSTKLRHITPYLKDHELNETLDELSKNLDEWSGGTKIGHCLRDFVAEHQDKLTRKTIVFIVSDGWDTGEIEVLEEAMLKIKSQSKNVIWLNPLKGDQNYQPTCQGMQAALPYIDYFGGAHNLQSMKDFTHHIANLL